MCKIAMIGLFVFLGLGSHAVIGEIFQHKNGSNESTRIFSPRMDYDEWTPLGRGDPLKNDPTFDYVPPVLDRVQYWLGETQASSTDASPKRDVLVLGVTAKKTSPKIPEHFLKFMDSSKYTEEPPPNLHQGDYKNRNDFTGSTGAEPPKVIRNTKFRSGPSSAEFRITNPKYFANSQIHFGEKSKLYTMMLPPPVTNTGPSSVQFNVIQNLSSKKPEYPSRPEHLSGNPSASTSVSFEKSNLIYTSSQQLSDWSAGDSNSYTNPVRNQNNPAMVAWPINLSEKDRFDEDHHQGSASMNHEVVVVGQNTQNANIIVDNSEEVINTQVVVGQKNMMEIDQLEKISSKDKPEMEIVLANSSGKIEDKKNDTVTVVMPINYHVETTTESDFFKPTNPMPSTTMLIISSTTSIPSPKQTWQQTSFFPPPRMPNKFFPRRPTTPQVFSNMFGTMSITGAPHTMMQQSFRFTTRRPSPLGSILKMEEMITTTSTPSTTTTMTPSTTTTATTTTTTTRRPTSPSTTTSTTVADGFTTDSIFSHYKQPSVPINGPMYLIIQGHSKVKTYKPMISKHDIIAETTVRPMTKFERFVNENTRRITSTAKTIDDTTTKKMIHKNLMNLVEKGVSAFTLPAE